MNNIEKIEQRLANIERYLLNLNHFIDGLTIQLVRTNDKLEQLRLVEEEPEPEEWWQ